MPIEIKVPQVGESITEVQIANWLKGLDKRVERDEPLVTIESDKATVDIPAPASGVVTQILKLKGDAKVGEVIGYIDETAKPRAQAEPEAALPPPTGPAKADAPAQKPGAPASPVAATDKENPKVTPLAKRILQEHGLSAADVQATGPGGRVLKEDVLRHVEESAKDTAVMPNKASPFAAPQPEPAVKSLRPEERKEEVVRMTPMRRTIAHRLVEAQSVAALLTTFNEIDMTSVMALRQKHKDAFQQRYGAKLGFMSFFVKAAVEALKLLPQMNAEVRGEEILYRNYFDIGIAVGGGKGLVVPILRNAEHMSFSEIERAIADFGKRAEANKIGLEELKGGTFTISNGGVYGSLLSTPIVNPPQSGILGLHAIQERPVAREGQVVIRPMMYVAVTYDHRIVDGREAVTFLKRIKDLVEEPTRLLLEI